MRLDAATVLLQWATGGLFFLWVTTRRREVGLGYGWLLRGVFLVLAAGAAPLPAPGNPRRGRRPGGPARAPRRPAPAPRRPAPSAPPPPAPRQRPPPHRPRR